MFRRLLDLVMPWRVDRRAAAAAKVDAHQALLEVAERKGRTDQVVRSIQSRVYAENHISNAVEAMILGRRR